MGKIDKAPGKKSMDIAKPGKSLPDNSARPVIVTHRPMVQDPMVKSDVAKDKPESSAGTSKFLNVDTLPRDKKVIQPVGELPEPKEQQPPEQDRPINTDKTEIQDNNGEADQNFTEPDISKLDTTEAAVVAAVASQAQSRGKKNGEPDERDKAKEAHLKKLVADKTYFVTIGQVSRRRNRRAAAIFAVFLIIFLAGAYATVDAGLIATNIELPIDLIKN